MQLFSRTALVAIGTTAALATSTLSAPAMAAEVTPAATTVTYYADQDPSDKESENSSGSSDIDVKDITTWLSIITGVIGILSTMITFSTVMERSMR